MAGILLNGTNYSGGDGTNVVANPSGTASTDLTKLQVDNTIYNIPSGGGGPVDADLSTSSTNAVQNQTITNALFNLIIGGLISNHEIQVLGLTATKSFSQNDIFLAYESNVDHIIFPVVATTNIAIGDYLTSTSGANRNVYIIDGLYPYINSSLDSMAQYVANMVKANPSGTGSTDLTKLEVGGTVYNIPSSGATSLNDLSDVDTTTCDKISTILVSRNVYVQGQGYVNIFEKVPSPISTGYWSNTLIANNTTADEVWDVSNWTGLDPSKDKGGIRLAFFDAHIRIEDAINHYTCIPMNYVVDFSHVYTDPTSVFHDLTLIFYLENDYENHKTYLHIKKSKSINLYNYDVHYRINVTN